MTRLRTFFLFAALLALATTFVACGDSESEGEKSPQTVVEDATLEGVKSGELNLSLGVTVEGDEGGTIEVGLSGPFNDAGNAEQAPELDLTAEASGSIDGEDVDFEGGLTLLPGKAFVNYQGTEYAVDPTTYNFVEAALKEAQSQGGAEEDSPDVTACQEAATKKLDFGSFVDNLSDDGSADVGGTATTKVSGDLDVPGALDALIELTEDPACSAQLGAASPLPSGAELKQAKSVVEEMVKTAHVDLYVGDDDIVRRATAQLSIEAPEEEGEEPQSVNLDFDLSLTGVNEEQSIDAPNKTKPLTDLFVKLGVNPIELAGLLGGEGGLADPEGIGNLLEGLGGDTGGGSSGGSAEGGGQAYRNCLEGARSPVDLQRCAKLNQ